MLPNFEENPSVVSLSLLPVKKKSVSTDCSGRKSSLKGFSSKDSNSNNVFALSSNNLLGICKNSEIFCFLRLELMRVVLLYWTKACCGLSQIASNGYFLYRNSTSG